MLLLLLRAASRGGIAVCVQAAIASTLPTAPSLPPPAAAFNYLSANGYSE